MEMLLEQAIKNLKYMCNHSNLEHDRKSLRTVIKFVESYDERLKADMVAMLEEISLKFDEQYYANRHELHDDSLNRGLEQGQSIIQQKINELKAESKDKE